MQILLQKCDCVVEVHDARISFTTDFSCPGGPADRQGKRFWRRVASGVARECGVLNFICLVGVGCRAKSNFFNLSVEMFCFKAKRMCLINYLLYC